jgi:Tol biopolymer transport system component
MNADGSGETLLASSGGWPAWSPWGDKIAFQSPGNCNAGGITGWPCLYFMGADGSNQTNLNVALTDGVLLAWSPDATKIAFISWHDPQCGGGTQADGLYTVNADGSGQTLLYFDCTRGNPEDVSWSPDGKRLAIGMDSTPSSALCGIYVINADGTGLSRMTNPDCSSTTQNHPSWSADGQNIFFQQQTASTGVYQIFSVNVVSFGVTLITSTVSANPNPDCRRCGRFDRL